jgi:adenylate cyclase
LLHRNNGIGRMSIEIERRFLVADPSIMDGLRGRAFVQGYFGMVDGLSVRVRLIDDAEARLTFKGPPRGIRRLEYEYPIAIEKARRALRALPSNRLIRKLRYRLPAAGQLWVVDRFQAAHDGLLLAEIELARPDQRVALPRWVGREVTFDERYRNSRLAAAAAPPRSCAA